MNDKFTEIITLPQEQQRNYAKKRYNLVEVLTGKPTNLYLVFQAVGYIATCEFESFSWSLMVFSEIVRKRDSEPCMKMLDVTLIAPDRRFDLLKSIIKAMTEKQYTTGVLKAVEGDDDRPYLAEESADDLILHIQRACQEESFTHMLKCIKKKENLPFPVRKQLSEGEENGE